MVVWKIERKCDSDFDPCWELVAIVETATLAEQTLLKYRETLDKALGIPSGVCQDDDGSWHLQHWNSQWRASEEEVHQYVTPALW